MRKIQITKLVEITEEVPIDNIKSLLVKAKLWHEPTTDSWEIDVYCSPNGSRYSHYLSRAFSIPCPKELIDYLDHTSWPLSHDDEYKLLEYARKNIPEDFTQINLSYRTS